MREPNRTFFVEESRSNTAGNFYLRLDEILRAPFTRLQGLAEGHFMLSPGFCQATSPLLLVRSGVQAADGAILARL